MELISVIVPIYKVEPYLDECIQSIVNQTYKNLEIILVDDESPDNCPAMCDEWAKKDSRIVVIHKKNGGLSAARNAGLEIAHGKYIGFVDSDDYIAHDMYEHLLTALKNAHVKISSCLFYRVFDGGNIVCLRSSFKKNTVMNAEQAIKAVFFEQIGTAVWCKLYEKSVFEEFEFPVGETNEDYPLIVPLIVKSGGLVVVDKAMYYYRKRTSSITSSDYATGYSVRFMYKNLQLIQKQLVENNINCKKEYAFFAASNAYDMAIVMEKSKDRLDADRLDLLRLYRLIMRKGMIAYMCSRHSSLKNKALYFLVLMKMIRPLYKLLNKPL